MCVCVPVCVCARAHVRAHACATVGSKRISLPSLFGFGRPNSGYKVCTENVFTHWVISPDPKKRFSMWDFYGVEKFEALHFSIYSLLGSVVFIEWLFNFSTGNDIVFKEWWSFAPSTKIYDLYVI